TGALIRLEQRGEQTIDSVNVLLDCRSHLESGQNFRGLRTNGDDFGRRKFFQESGKIKAGVEMIDSRAAGEEQPIGAGFDETLGRTGLIDRLGDSLITGDVIDNRAQ